MGRTYLIAQRHTYIYIYKKHTLRTREFSIMYLDLSEINIEFEDEVHDRKCRFEPMKIKVEDSNGYTYRALALFRHCKIGCRHYKRNTYEEYEEGDTIDISDVGDDDSIQIHQRKECQINMVKIHGRNEYIQDERCYCTPGRTLRSDY